MDYEKAYKAAKRVAAHWIENGCEATEKILLETIFPELKESEDERMWDKILAHFDWHSHAPYLTHQECDEIKAFLEKQKELLHVDALKVKLFVDEHIDEWHWDFTNEHITAFVLISHLSELVEFIGPDALSDTNVKCYLKDGYIAIPNFDDILNYYELDEEDMKAIFPKDGHRY